MSLNIETDHECTPLLESHWAAVEAVREGLTMPDADEDGRVRTLNFKGAMSPYLDVASAAFVEDAARPKVKVLEIGSGYGLACRTALAKGSQSYTANDLDLRHLKILARTVGELDARYLKRLHLLHGGLPDGLRLPADAYDAVLIARVLHFMRPQEVIASLKVLYGALKPGGRIYGVMLSPYVRSMVPFMAEFERRQRIQDPFPGYVERVGDVADVTVFRKQYLYALDQHFLFFDVDTARRCFETAGFVVDRCEPAPIVTPSSPAVLDGRENTVVFAHKA